MQVRHRFVSHLVAVVCIGGMAAACGNDSSDPNSESMPRLHVKADGTGQQGTLTAAADIDVTGAGQAPSEEVSDENVVGGKPVDIAGLPWTVALVTPGETDNFCGGVLISPTRVLTAAHCTQEVDRDEQGRPQGTAYITGPESIHVLAGRSRLDDTGGQEVEVTKVWQSEQYDNASYSNDYAILDLAQPVDQTVIKLPRSSDTGLWKPGVRVVGAGWGCQQPNAYPKKACEDTGLSPLEWTTFATNDGSACRTAFGENSFDSDTGLCLQNESTESQTCNGDSGGPYIVYGSDTKWYLVALVSYGPTGCDPTKPVVGALVPHLLDGAGALREDLRWTTCEGAKYCTYPE